MYTNLHYLNFLAGSKYLKPCAEMEIQKDYFSNEMFILLGPANDSLEEVTIYKIFQVLKFWG